MSGMSSTRIYLLNQEKWEKSVHSFLTAKVVGSWLKFFASLGRFVGARKGWKHGLMVTKFQFDWGDAVKKFEIVAVPKGIIFLIQLSERML